MKFSREEYWSGLPFSSLGNLPILYSSLTVETPAKEHNLTLTDRPAEEKEIVSGGKLTGIWEVSARDRIGNCTLEEIL